MLCKKTMLKFIIKIWQKIMKKRKLRRKANLLVKKIKKNFKIMNPFNHPYKNLLPMNPIRLLLSNRKKKWNKSNKPK